MIVVSDSSPLITLAHAHYLELLHEFYGQVTIPREVHEEVTVAGAGLPGAEEVRRASWIRVQHDPMEPANELKAACADLGTGESSVIYLASNLNAGLALIDEEKARRVAKSVGLSVAGSIAILERGAILKRVVDLRSVYLSLLAHGIRFSHNLLEQPRAGGSSEVRKVTLQHRQLLHNVLPQLVRADVCRVDGAFRVRHNARRTGNAVHVRLGQVGVRYESPDRAVFGASYRNAPQIAWVDFRIRG